MIDAAWTGGAVDGDTGSGNYTTVVWEEGVGKGFTITPAGGDTGEKLFLSNSGQRYDNGGRYNYGTYGRFLSANQHDATNAWALYFFSDYPSGWMAWVSKLYARSIRCVRS